MPTLRGRGGGASSRSSSQRRPSIAPVATELSSTIPPDSSAGDDYFRCDVCYHLRSNARRKDPANLGVDECCYEDEFGEDIEDAEEQHKWCRTCHSEKLRPKFWTEEPAVEYEKCNHCARRIERSPASTSAPPSSAMLPPGPTSTQSTNYSDLPRSSYHRHRHGGPRPNLAVRQQQADLERLQARDPPLEPDEFDDDNEEWKSAAALNDKD